MKSSKIVTLYEVIHPALKKFRFNLKYESRPKQSALDQKQSLFTINCFDSFLNVI